MARFLRGTADWKETRPAFEKVRGEAFQTNILFINFLKISSFKITTVKYKNKDIYK